MLRLDHFSTLPNQATESAHRSEIRSDLQRNRVIGVEFAAKGADVKVRIERAAIVPDARDGLTCPDRITDRDSSTHRRSLLCAVAWPGSGKVRLADSKDDGVQVDSILIDQAEFGEAVRQARARNFDLSVALGLPVAASLLA